MRWLVALFMVVAGLQGTVASVLAWEQEPGDGRFSSVALADAELAGSIDARIELPAFRFAVPFRTQKDGSQWQGSNCGPAILGMILDGFGETGQSTSDLRFRAHTYQGTVGMRTGTALDHIAHVAEDFGVRTHGLYGAGGGWRSWSADDVREQLRLGRPVMPLVRLYLLPGYESSLPRWGHYILITGMTEDGFFYSDPLQTDAVNGNGGFMSADRLMRAMQASHIPGQAVAFDGAAGLLMAGI
ncbi:MAG: C39 family peptidase [Chloroflexota bacterium]